MRYGMLKQIMRYQIPGSTLLVKNTMDIKFLIILVILLLLQSCKSPTGPKIGNNPPGPGRRDYTWTVDTLEAIEGYMSLYYLWGAAANDLWAVGSAYRNADCIWHYNGVKWERTPASGLIDPCGIWGSGNNNIWMGSSDASFWHYDGLSWSRICQYKIEGYDYALTQRMDGIAPNEIYAVGFAQKENGEYKGIIMHYDGKNWEQVSIPDQIIILSNIYYNQQTDKYLISGFVNETGENIIYLFDRKTLKIINSCYNNCWLNKVKDKIYLNDGTQRIYRYDKTKFNLFKDFTGTNYGGRMWGRSEIDFFTDNRDGIGHYNGTNLVTVFKRFSNDWSIYESIVFENDFFSTWRNDTTISIHGKLR